MTAPPPPPPPAAGYPYGPEYQQHGPQYPSPYRPVPAAMTLAHRLGPRLWRRAEPRLAISLGAIGAALVLGGGLVWSVGYLVAGTDLDFGSDSGELTTHGQSRRFLGFALFLVCTLVGYGVLLVRRRGALATAGAVAGAFGLPLALLFVSFDLADLFHGELPFSLDAVYLVSIVVWLVSYFAVPGARGRPFYLGIAGSALAAYIAFKAAGSGSIVRSAAESIGSRGLTGSGTGTVAAIGLIFGLGYYATAAVLDRHEYHGAAIGMAYAAFFTTVGGVVAAVPDFKMVGTGILLIVLGVVLGWYGGRFGRRFTTWAWLAGLLVGVGLLVAKAFPHSYTGAGITLIVVGVLVAVGAQLLTSAGVEAPELPDEAAA